MNKPHKHAKWIKAWADGAQIQYKDANKWHDYRASIGPSWDEDIEYRIKQEPKPYIVCYAYFFCGVDCALSDTPKQGMANGLKLTFDGETGKLKKAEVLE